VAKKKRKRRANGLPWYWKTRDSWCVPGDPKKTALRDKHGELVRGADNEVEALAVWHEMMSLTNAGRAGAENEVKVVLEMYLQDAQRRKLSTKTLANYTGWFQSFIDQWKGLVVRDLKPFHVHQWWEKSHPEWGPSYRNLSGSALKAAFNWAAKPGKGGAIIPTNPLDGMELPTMRKRSSEVVISQAEFDRLLALVESESVRDVLLVAWETGTRPVNLSRATAQNVTDDGKALFFADWNTDPDEEVHKTFKRTGRPLVVPLPAAAREVVAKLKVRYPEGRLFRTSQGLDWTEHRLANIVRHYAKRAGLEGRFIAYSCRHTRATALLEQGMSPGDVAAVLGNTPGVVHRNYSHVSANTDRLLKLMEAGKAT
jgi:integrase